MHFSYGMGIDLEFWKTFFFGGKNLNKLSVSVYSDTFNITAVPNFLQEQYRFSQFTLLNLYYKFFNWLTLKYNFLPLLKHATHNFACSAVLTNNYINMFICLCILVTYNDFLFVQVTMWAKSMPSISQSTRQMLSKSNNGNLYKLPKHFIVDCATCTCTAWGGNARGESLGVISERNAFLLLRPQRPTAVARFKGPAADVPARAGRCRS